MNRTDVARQTLHAHTVAHLRDLAREAGVRGRSRMRKADLVEALLPTRAAEMDQVRTRQAEANRRASLAIATDSPYPAPAVSRETAEFSLLLTSVRGGESPGSGRFASIAEARSHVRRELTPLTSIWQVWVLNAAGERVARGYRSGRGGTGKRWIWEPRD